MMSASLCRTLLSLESSFWFFCASLLSWLETVAQRGRELSGRSEGAVLSRRSVGPLQVAVLRRGSARRGTASWVQLAAPFCGSAATAELVNQQTTYGIYWYMHVSICRYLHLNIDA